MALVVENVTDNPSLPVSTALAYLPDQLIYDLKNGVTMNINVAAGSAVFARGTVMGMITEGGAGLTGSTVAASGNTGDGAITGIGFGEAAMKGNYIVHFTAATTFDVISPDGTNLGLVSATHYGPKTNVSEINFTFTAGTTAMVSGDEIVIVAVPSAANTAWTVSKASHTDGTQIPRGILVDQCTQITTGLVQASVYVSGEFNGNALIFDASWTLAEISALMPATIFIKTPVSATDPTNE